MIVRFSMLIMAFMLSFSGHAQVLKSNSVEMAMQPHYVVSNSSSAMYFDLYTRSFEKGIVYPSPSEAVMVMTDPANSALQLIKIDDNYSTLWTLPVKDNIIFLAKRNDQIILFTATTSTKKSTKIKMIKASLVDAATGKQISEKVVFENGSDSYIDPKLNVDENMNFQSLLVRYSVSSTEVATTMFESITFDHSLGSIHKERLSSSLEAFEFIGCTSNGSGDIFLVGASKTSIIAEKFPKGTTKAVAQINIPFDAGKKSLSEGWVKNDPLSPDQITISIKYKNTEKDPAILSANFDFAIKKAYQHVQLLDNRYSKKVNVRYVDELRIQNIQFYSDKILVEQESQFYYDELFCSREILVSVYDKKMNLLSEISVPRRADAHLPGQRSAGYVLKNGKLNILFNTLNGAKYDTHAAIIDMEKLSTEKITPVDKGNLNKESTLEGGSILSFGNELIVPYVFLKGFVIHSRGTVFSKVEL
jgi:hypothetical protein